jgi:hypothetical protein
MNEVLASTVAVVVVDGNNRAVDGELLKVGTSMAVDLGIKVREDATLKKRILSEVDTTNNVSRLELRWAVSNPYAP